MKMPYVNVLVAIASPSHIFHTRATFWLTENPNLATCAITELGMLRVLIQLGTPVALAEAHLENFVHRHRAVFIPCELSAEAIRAKIEGPKQVTDAYLTALCESKGLTLATFDTGIYGASQIP